MQTLLTDIGFSLLEQGYKIGLDWLGQFARVIIEGVGIVGLGIVVFTLVLKAITLPFDIYQRVKMRKQTLVMRDMKEDLEKLQQQYANDKDMYNTKMMELYKKNGYSMFGACLPMILSLVILIVAFQGFRVYSQYANLDIFVNMAGCYNAAVLENGVVGPNYQDVLEKTVNSPDYVSATGKPADYLFAKPYHFAQEGLEDPEGENYTIEEKERTWTEDGVVYRLYYREVEQTKLDEKGNVVTDGEGEPVMETVRMPYLEVKAENEAYYLYYYYSLDYYNASAKTFSNRVVREEYRVDVERFRAAAKDFEKDAFLKEGEESVSEDVAISRYLAKRGSHSARTWYNANQPSFLWVRNVWFPDVSYSHPIPEYSTFSGQFRSEKVTLQSGEKKSVTAVLDENSYADLTYEFEDEMNAPNGYFILIVLSIGLMVLSQFITMRSQKETNQYQTVDGQGARTQKVMLVMMPLIYAIFAFMYSAAFTIYMTMSSLIALLITLVSNFVLGRVFRKKEEARIRETYGRTLSWMKEDGKKGPKNEKGGKPAKNDKDRRKK